MADEIPFEDLPAFLQHLLGPDPVRDNPSFSWSAPRPPVSMPEPWQPPAGEVRVVPAVRPLAPVLPKRPAPKAQGSLF